MFKQKEGDCMETFERSGLRITWLNGGNNHLDGGAMFGVVPKALWTRKYPESSNNTIELRTDPLLIEIDDRLILIEAGIGRGKLSEKQKRNLGVTEESQVEVSLEALGYRPEDIDTICMTHLHNDHAGGLTAVNERGELYSVFPNATIYVSETEWDEMRAPNIRSKNAYWKENWEPIQEQVKTFTTSVHVHPSIEMIHTGGHSAGHSIVKITVGDEVIYHMGDLLGTHAHLSSLWVMAYDDYPMDSIAQKEAIIRRGIDERAYFTFYHDAYYRVIQWSKDTKEMQFTLKRKR